MNDGAISEDGSDAEAGEGLGGAASKEKMKQKMRGKNKSMKRYLRKKRKNVVDPALVSSADKIRRLGYSHTHLVICTYL